MVGEQYLEQSQKEKLGIPTEEKLSEDEILKRFEEARQALLVYFKQVEEAYITSYSKLLRKVDSKKSLAALYPSAISADTAVEITTQGSFTIVNHGAFSGNLFARYCISSFSQRLTYSLFIIIYNYFTMKKYVLNIRDNITRVAYVWKMLA